jgi:hypothetical protein
METKLLLKQNVTKTMIPFLLFLVLTLFPNIMVFSQIESKGDTLIIGPKNHDGSMVGALNYYFYADTTLTGDRAHSVYKLHRGAQYLLTERIVADFPLTIVADKPVANNAPPIIRTGLKEDGSTVENLLELYNNATFKNLFISGISPSGDSPSEWMIILLDASDKKMVFDGCIFENIYSWWGFIEDWGSHNVHEFTNCYFRNFGEPGGTWNGAIMGAEPSADSLIYRNCTYFNFDCCATSMDEKKGALYTEFDHCTFANSAVHQFIMNKPVTAKVTNNIFFNCNAYSEYPKAVSSHADQETQGIIHFFQFDPELLNSTWQSKYDPNADGTLTEDERAYDLKNNVWFYSQPIVDFWNIDDSIFSQMWYNNAVKEFFVNNANPKDWVVKDLQGNAIDTVHMTAHPLFVESNTMNSDPQFKNIGNSVDLFAQHLTSSNKIAKGEDVDPVYWFYDPDQNPTTFEWPLSESLMPTNPLLMNAGTDGKTIGSSLWENNYFTKIDESRNTVNFSLSQNFPNPFKSSTVIEYSIEQKDKVELVVYDILGAKVATLVSKEQSAGKYQVSFNPNKQYNGIYFYTLTVGKTTLTKMMTAIN